MDRNDTVQVVIIVVDASLSARRAWIEMFSVREVFANFESLSARRAWIEIWWLHCWQLAARGRSPQGERG